MSTHGASIAELLNFSRDNKLGDSFVNIANSIEQMNIIYLKIYLLKVTMLIMFVNNFVNNFVNKYNFKWYVKL